MKKMLVTGATSFIGTAFLRKATESGWQITAVVRRNSKKKEQIKSFSHVNIIELNMDEYSQLGEIIETIDCFVHLAWDGTRGSQREDSELQKLNYEGQKYFDDIEKKKNVNFRNWGVFHKLYRNESMSYYMANFVILNLPILGNLIYKLKFERGK